MQYSVGWVGGWVGQQWDSVLHKDAHMIMQSCCITSMPHHGHAGHVHALMCARHSHDGTPT